MSPGPSRLPGGWTLALISWVAGAAFTGLIAVTSVRFVGQTDERLESVYVENARAVERLRGAIAQASASARAYLLTHDEATLEQTRRAQAPVAANLASLRASTSSADGLLLLDRVGLRYEAYESSLDRILALSRTAEPSEVRLAVENESVPSQAALDGMLAAFGARKEQQLVDARRTSALARERALAVVATVGGVALGAAAILAALLRRTLRRLTRERVELATSLLRVEQSNRDLDAFAGRAAHDLRNALSPMVAAAYVLRTGTLPPDKFAAVCDGLDRATQRANALVESLLAFSRLDHRIDRTASSPLRLVLVDVLEQLHAPIAQADASIDARVDDANVQCPPALLQIVLANVIGNAVKFVRDRPTRRVSITSQRLRGGIELRVDDTGPGIPEGALRRIFEPFFRVPGTTAPGTGIGLATVRRILDAYGGRIRAESTPDAGASFVLWIPLAEAHACLPPPQPMAEQAPRPHT